MDAASGNSLRLHTEGSAPSANPVHNLNETTARLGVLSCKKDDSGSFDISHSQTGLGKNTVLSISERHNHNTITTSSSSSPTFHRSETDNIKSTPKPDNTSLLEQSNDNNLNKYQVSATKYEFKSNIMEDSDSAKKNIDKSASLDIYRTESSKLESQIKKTLSGKDNKVISVRSWRTLAFILGASCDEVSNVFKQTCPPDQEVKALLGQNSPDDLANESLQNRRRELYNAIDYHDKESSDLLKIVIKKLFESDYQLDLNLSLEESFLALLIDCEHRLGAHRFLQTSNLEKNRILEIVKLMGDGHHISNYASTLDQETKEASKHTQGSPFNKSKYFTTKNNDHSASFTNRGLMKLSHTLFGSIIENVASKLGVDEDNIFMSQEFRYDYKSYLVVKLNKIQMKIPESDYYKKLNLSTKDAMIAYFMQAEYQASKLADEEVYKEKYKGSSIRMALLTDHESPLDKIREIASKIDSCMVNTLIGNSNASTLLIPAPEGSREYYEYIWRFIDS